MKKMLIGLFILGSFSSFAREVLILKTSTWGRCDDVYGTYSSSRNIAKDNAEKECFDFGGTIKETKCVEDRVYGSKYYAVSWADSCAVICDL